MYKQSLISLKLFSISMALYLQHKLFRNEQTELFPCRSPSNYDAKCVCHDSRHPFPVLPDYKGYRPSNSAARA